MKLDVPFYENKETGIQCMQVTMQTVLKHFLDKEFSLAKLDELTQRGEGMWTWTPQIVSVLYDLGLDVSFYSKTDLAPYLEGESFIRSHFGADAEKMLQFTDVPVLVASVKKLMDYSIFSHKQLSFEEIEEQMKKGCVPLMLVDFNKIAGREGAYQGHFIVVTGFDDDSVYYHESGPHNPLPNVKVPKKVFIDAWNANGTDNDVVIVKGKK